MLDPALSIPVFVVCVEALKRILEESSPDGDLVADIRSAIERSAARGSMPVRDNVRTAIERLVSGLNSGQWPSLAEIGAELGVDRCHLGRQFRADTGLEFRQWARALRIQSSLPRLITTLEQIAQVAYGARYQYASQFDREFGELLTMSPKAFRRLAQRVLAGTPAEE
jgi:AraC-like DNA-binding protein